MSSRSIGRATAALTLAMAGLMVGLPAMAAQLPGVPRDRVSGPAGRTAPGP